MVAVKVEATVIALLLRVRLPPDRVYEFWKSSEFETSPAERVMVSPPAGIAEGKSTLVPVRGSPALQFPPALQSASAVVLVQTVCARAGQQWKRVAARKAPMEEWQTRRRAGMMGGKAAVRECVGVKAA